VGGVSSEGGQWAGWRYLGGSNLVARVIATMTLKDYATRMGFSNPVSLW